METRNIKLTLEKAKEWYNSNSAELREIALQAYTEDELKTMNFSDIKTFWDACKALGLDEMKVMLDLQGCKSMDFNREHLVAIYKLDIIHKALNKDWKPSLVKGKVYYSFVRFYPAGKDAKEATANNNWSLGPTFIADSKKYTLVGGACYYYGYDGLSNFGFGCGDVLPYLGLLGCKSREVAEHMSRYFSKEIFEATYTHHTGTYEWV